MTSDFFSGADIGKLIAAGVLTPLLGLIGAKARELFEARDLRQEMRRAIEEVTVLVEFSQTLNKASESGGVLAKVPAGSLDNLRSAIAEKVQLLAAQISRPAVEIKRDQARTRGLLDRLFLLHRPLVWWAWPLHVLYYGAAGMFVIVCLMIINDFSTKASDRGIGVAIGVFFAIVCTLLNVLANLADRKKSRSLVKESDNALDAVARL